MTSREDEISILAGGDWQPWPGRPEDCDLVPTPEEYGRYYAVLFRLCVVVMHKSKAELIEVAAGMQNSPADDGDYETAFEGLLSQLAAAREFADGMHQLAVAAEARCLAAASSLAMQLDG